MAKVWEVPHDRQSVSTHIEHLSAVSAFMASNLVHNRPDENFQLGDTEAFGLYLLLHFIEEELYRCSEIIIKGGCA